MNIRDVLKDSFIEQFNASISTKNVMITLLVTTVIGIYIFYVYRLVCKRAFYSKSFAVSLVVVSLVTAIIILSIQSSVVISLGMVGALSIVRFRTAVKNPMDLAFLFWAIAIGIICGANLYEIAIEGSLAITIVMMLLFLVPRVKPTLLLVVSAADPQVESKVLEIVKQDTDYYKVKSRNITSLGIELVVELRTKKEAELVQAVSDVGQVESVSLMTYDGEATY